MVRSERLVGLAELAARTVVKANEIVGHRYLVGIAGPPAAGKSTLALHLRDAVNAIVAGMAEIAPMDGFHLSTAELRVKGKIARKGQPDTFDVDGFSARLRELRNSPGVRVSWPIYDRARHDPVPDGLVFAYQAVAIVEGNYLLMDSLGWGVVQPLLDEVWYLDANIGLVEQRLTQRHILGGKTDDEAREKIRDSDLPNMTLIDSTKYRADFLLREYGGRYLMQVNH